MVRRCSPAGEREPSIAGGGAMADCSVAASMKIDRRSESRSACALRWLRVARCSRTLHSRSRTSEAWTIAVSAWKAATTCCIEASILRWKLRSEKTLSKKTSDETSQRDERLDAHTIMLPCAICSGGKGPMRG